MFSFARISRYTIIGIIYTFDPNVRIAYIEATDTFNFNPQCHGMYRVLYKYQVLALPKMEVIFELFKNYSFKSLFHYEIFS